MQKVPFAKYSSSGNDFVLIDNREPALLFPSLLIKHLSDRHEGVGADGVIFLENPDDPFADFKMRYFNNDGKEADFCGNGLRAIAHFAAHLKIKNKNHFLVQTKSGNLHVFIEKEFIKTEMPSPSEVKSNFKLDPIPYFLSYAKVGVPHVVLFLPDFEKYPLKEWGPYLRSHPFFGPAGANVNFVVAKENNIFEIKTYERGVEDFTGACGSGALASAYFIHKNTGQNKITLIPDSKKDLIALFSEETSPPFLLGNPVLTFEGFFPIE